MPASTSFAWFNIKWTCRLLLPKYMDTPLDDELQHGAFSSLFNNHQIGNACLSTFMTKEKTNSNNIGLMIYS